MEERGVSEETAQGGLEADAIDSSFELLPRKNVFLRGGYGARAIALSKDRRTLFVGYKDGSISVIDLERAVSDPRYESGRRLRARRRGKPAKAGIRAIYEWGAEWLLVADDHWSLIAVNWRRRSVQEHVVRVLAASPIAEDFPPITLIDDWDDPSRSQARPPGQRPRIVVSCRQGSTWVFDIDETGSSEGSPFRLVDVQRLEGVSAACGLVRAGETRMLISESGALWVVEADGRGGPHEVPFSIRPLEPWRRSGFDRPGLISNAAAFSVSEEIAGIYLSTDEGVFRVRLETVSTSGPSAAGAQRRAKPTIIIEKEFLPGFAGMAMAVTQEVWDDKVFLWVSDLRGDVTLYWRTPYRGRALGPADELPVKGDGVPPRWRRLGFRLESSQVMRSIATRLQLEGSGEALIIGQACRSDQIVVTWYAKRLGSDQTATVSFAIADLLSNGTWDRLKRREGSAVEKWAPEAVFARFLEQAGDHPAELASFLANPTEALAWSVLGEIVERGNGAVPAGEAILCWTYALIATVHRRMEAGRRAQLCLGIVRWLRKISERCRAAAVEDPRYAELSEVVESAVLHARKWGVFGKSYSERDDIALPFEALGRESADPSGREDFAIPFEALARESSAQFTASDYRTYDWIVYAALLFGRRVNLETELLPPSAPGSTREALTPWDVRHLRTGEGDHRRVFFAVSHGGESRVYEQKFSQADRALSWELLGSTLSSRLADEGPARGYSRRIVLANIEPGGGEQRPYLLEAPTTATREAQCFRLWWLQSEEDGRLRAAGEAALDRGETVYSMLELAPGLVLAGLLVTASSQLPLVLVRVQPDGELRLLRGSGPAFPFAYPEATPGRGYAESQPNPIQALAFDEGQTLESRRSGEHRVVVGAADGQVLLVRIIVSADCFSILSPSLPDVSGARSAWERVGRLGSPVRALAFRTREGRGKSSARVFAGSSDGTIIAFEQLRSAQPGRERGTGSPIEAEGGPAIGPTGEASFAVLWATKETGPIARLHLLDRVVLDETDKAEPIDLALALTQPGRAILFLDSLEVGGRELHDEAVHQRFRVPGERLGRFALGSSVFGSDLLPSDLPKATAGQVARLAVVTGEGKLRQLTLHYPKYTEARKRMFARIHKAWLSTLSRGVRVSLLRKIESMYAAAPNLPTLCVRWIFTRQAGDRSWEARIDGDLKELPPHGPPRQWIASHLHPLVELDEQWSRPGAAMESLLKAALRAARKVGDPRLFREIIEVTLRRANEALFLQARGRLSDFEPKFAALMHDLDEMKGAWLGESGVRDTKIRIVIAQNLLDGDTLWSFSEALFAKRDELRPAIAAVHRQLEEFLAAGEPLLALETMRAVNLAILRACRRLGAATPRSELHWDVIEAYFLALGSFAARMAHSERGNLGEADAVSHEVCRAYALGMLACPSHALRIAIWMCEADLPPRFTERAFQQLDLLGQILPELSISNAHRQMVRAALGPPPTVEADSLLAAVAGVEGKDNLELLGAWEPFDNILKWLGALSGDLATRGFEGSLAEVVNLRRDLGTSPGGDAGLGKDAADQVRHSRHFWQQALDALITELPAGFGGASSDVSVERSRKTPESRSVGGPALATRSQLARPALVLFARNLDRWCARQITRLHYLKAVYQIFEPPCSLYVRSLERLHVAAREFPRGAALQKNVVTGVLGHSLLEMLDEHILELWELAQAMDPQRVWSVEDAEASGGQRSPVLGGKSTGAGSTAGSRDTQTARLANYLLRTASRAEVVPKNLRTLRSLMGYASDALPAGPPRSPADMAGTARSTGVLPNADRGEYLLSGLFDSLSKWWGVETLPEMKLDARAYHFLRVTLSELDQNHRLHGLGDERPMVVTNGESLFAELNSPRDGLLVKFPFASDVANRDRLQRVLADSENLQRPVSPQRDSEKKSHGTGLYLANLAAAAVGWQLKIVRIETEDGISPAVPARPGWLWFELVRVHLQ